MGAWGIVRSVGFRAIGVGKIAGTGFEPVGGEIVAHEVQAAEPGSEAQVESIPLCGEVFAEFGEAEEQRIA